MLRRKLRLLPALVLCAAPFLSGCITTKIDDKYVPLERMREFPLLDDSRMTTIGGTIWTGSIKYWEDDSRTIWKRDAMFRHEQTHALRQKKHGLFTWLVRYVTDGSFMLYEEKVAAYYEIKSLQASGDIFPGTYAIYAQRLADSLTGYSNLQGRSISNQDAIEWFYLAVTDNWRPYED